MDDDTLDALIEPIANSNMTTAILQGTTIDNPGFGIRAGQKVEILLLNLNEDITTIVVGKANIEKYTQPLADMAKHIASNEELVKRVRTFANEKSFLSNNSNIIQDGTEGDTSNIIAEAYSSTNFSPGATLAICLCITAFAIFIPFAYYMIPIACRCPEHTSLYVKIEGGFGSF